jgi:hypothetical protein
MIVSLRSLQPVFRPMMNALAGLLGILFSASAFAQLPLPAKLVGTWSNVAAEVSDDVEIEVVRMLTPTDGLINVTWAPNCPKAETTVGLKSGYWHFKVQNCITIHGISEISARIQGLPGGKKYEGTYGVGKGRTLRLEAKSARAGDTNLLDGHKS